MASKMDLTNVATTIGWMLKTSAVNKNGQLTIINSSGKITTPGQIVVSEINAAAAAAGMGSESEPFIPEGVTLAATEQRLQKVQRIVAELSGVAPESGKADKRPFVVDPTVKIGVSLMTPAKMAARDADAVADKAVAKAATVRLAAVNARARYVADALAAGVKL